MRELVVCCLLLSAAGCASASESSSMSDAGKDDAAADSGQATGNADGAADAKVNPSPVPTTCVGKCGNQQCGVDACGHSCGTCIMPKICVNGLCEQT
jgi:hypothetical protein